MPLKVVLNNPSNNKTMKIIISVISIIVFFSIDLFSQCQTFNLSLNQAPNFCIVKPFGVGRNAGNSDMSFAERGIYFDAYQSSNGFRYRYSNYHPMSIEYHPWSNKMLFRYVDGTQSIQAGAEITSWKDAMTIENISGKIKIGNVSSPGNYLLYVEKGILAEQVVVALKNSNEWADYVFDSEYELMPLSQLEDYIKQNKHLPNVPTTEKMINNGNNLGQTDKLLLEKIEELTLYILELNKKIEKIEKQLE